MWPFTKAKAAPEFTSDGRDMAHAIIRDIIRSHPNVPPQEIADAVAKAMNILSAAAVDYITNGFNNPDRPKVSDAQALLTRFGKLVVIVHVSGGIGFKIYTGREIERGHCQFEAGSDHDWTIQASRGGETLQ
jgi:hypothetical protein